MNPNQPPADRLPSTPQPNIKTESSESDESDQSSEESSPQPNKLNGGIDGIDRNFMLNHCKGYAN